MKFKKLFICLTVALLVLLLVSGCVENRNQTIANSANSAARTAENGLKLILTVDDTTYQSGQEVNITIDEQNTLATVNHVTIADNWAVKGLALWPCLEGFPLGVAVYSGYYAPADLVKATPLIIQNPNEFYHCPMGWPTDSPYDFSPRSDTVTVAEPWDPPATVNFQLTGQVKPDGYFESDSYPSIRHDLPPGIYTVAGGDEWGNLVVLHFNVVNSVNADNMTPLEVLSVADTGLYNQHNPWWVEIDVKNISTQPLVALQALYITDNLQEDPFFFEVTLEKPLLPGQKSIGLGNARQFGENVPYSLKIFGTYQDGTHFYMTYGVSPHN
jgi:hypothetical protein